MDQARYQRLCIEAYVTSQRHLKWCPFPGCETVVQKQFCKWLERSSCRAPQPNTGAENRPDWLRLPLSRPYPAAEHSMDDNSVVCRTCENTFCFNCGQFHLPATCKVRCRAALSDRAVASPCRDEPVPLRADDAGLLGEDLCRWRCPDLAQQAHQGLLPDTLA
jgi:hypothetical protein